MFLNVINKYLFRSIREDIGLQKETIFTQKQELEYQNKRVRGGDQLNFLQRIIRGGIRQRIEQEEEHLRVKLNEDTEESRRLDAEKAIKLFSSVKPYIMKYLVAPLAIISLSYFMTSGSNETTPNRPSLSESYKGVVHLTGALGAASYAAALHAISGRDLRASTKDIIASALVSSFGSFCMQALTSNHDVSSSQRSAIFLGLIGAYGVYHSKTINGCISGKGLLNEYNFLDFKNIKKLEAKTLGPYLDKIQANIDRSSRDRQLIVARSFINRRDTSANEAFILATTTIIPAVTRKIFDAFKDEQAGLSLSSLILRVTKDFADMVNNDQELKNCIQQYQEGNFEDHNLLNQILNRVDVLKERSHNPIRQQIFTNGWKIIEPEVNKYIFPLISKLRHFCDDQKGMQMSIATQFLAKIYVYSILDDLLVSMGSECIISDLTPSNLVNNTAYSIAGVVSPLYLGAPGPSMASKVVKRILLAIPEENQQVSHRFGIATYYPDFTSALAKYSKGIGSSAIPAYHGMINDSPKWMQEWRNIDWSPGNVAMVSTTHCANTNEWRKKLIEAAQYNILISGNYCGDQAFDGILKLIIIQLEIKENLNFVIISSDKFLIDKNSNNPDRIIQNQTLVDRLKQDYPSRFSLVLSPDGWFALGKEILKKSTNHTKYIGIDWGRYYMMGGSGIKDNFNLSGVDNIFSLLPVELQNDIKHLKNDTQELRLLWNHFPEDKHFDYIDEKNKQWIKNAEECKSRLESSDHYAPKELSMVLDFIKDNTAVIQRITAENIHEEKDNVNLEWQGKAVDHVDRGLYEGLLDMLIPGNFRDQDFLFSDPNAGYSPNRQLFLEALRLAYRWDTLDENGTIMSPEDVAQMPIFKNGNQQEAKVTDSVTQRIMRTPMPTAPCKTVVKGFENINPGSVMMLYQGPEQPSHTNAFSAEVLKNIEAAIPGGKIVFNHMYFAPTSKIMNALIAAVDRGVNIEIITCSHITQGCPNGQKAFGPYNQLHWTTLAQKVSPEKRENIKVYLFEQNKKGLHKKIIVFDNGQNSSQRVIAGSSNFGYKSLVTSSDHEINFIADSSSLVTQTLKICEEDKRLSRYVDNNLEISRKDQIKAYSYEPTKPLVN